MTRFIEGAIPPLERMREPATLGRVARALRAVHDGPPIPGRFDSFRVVEDVPRRRRSSAAPSVPAASPGRSEVAARIERARAADAERAVPQRPAQRELHRRRRAAPDRRLGVRGHGRRLLRPRQLLDQPRARRGASARRCSTAYFGEVRPGERRALELMRFMSDFREAMWGVVQRRVSELDFDFDAYAAEHFERMRAHGRRAGVRSGARR